MKARSFQLPFGGVPSKRSNVPHGCKEVGTAFFRELAKVVGLQKGQYTIHYNACGDWGEMTFHTEDVYLWASFDRSLPGVLGRTVKGMKDYTGGANQWLDYSKATLENVIEFYRKIQKMKAPHVPTQSLHPLP